MTEFINFSASDAKANTRAERDIRAGSMFRRRKEGRGQLIAYRIGSGSPGREIGAITPREIVTLGNLYVSTWTRASRCARVAELCSPRFGSLLPVPVPFVPAPGRARVHHNNSPVIFIWSRFIARNGLWAAGTVCY